MTLKVERSRVHYIGLTTGKDNHIFCKFFRIRSIIKIRTKKNQILRISDVLEISSPTFEKYFGPILWDIYKLALLSSKEVKTESFVDITGELEEDADINEYNIVFSSVFKLLSNHPVLVKDDHYQYTIPHSPIYNQDGIEIEIYIEPLYDNSLVYTDLETIQIGRASLNN